MWCCCGPLSTDPWMCCLWVRIRPEACPVWCWGPTSALGGCGVQVSNTLTENPDPNPVGSLFYGEAAAVAAAAPLDWFACLSTVAYLCLGALCLMDEHKHACVWMGVCGCLEGCVSVCALFAPCTHREVGDRGCLSSQRHAVVCHPPRGVTAATSAASLLPHSKASLLPLRCLRLATPAGASRPSERASMHVVTWFLLLLLAFWGWRRAIATLSLSRAHQCGWTARALALSVGLVGSCRGTCACMQGGNCEHVQEACVHNTRGVFVNPPAVC